MLWLAVVTRPWSWAKASPCGDVLRKVLCTSSETGDRGSPEVTASVAVTGGCWGHHRPPAPDWPPPGWCPGHAVSPRCHQGGAWGRTQAEVLIFRYSVKLEFENQSVSLLHTSHTFLSSPKQKYQLWFADFGGIFGKKRKIPFLWTPKQQL